MKRTSQRSGKRKTTAEAAGCLVLSDDSFTVGELQRQRGTKCRWVLGVGYWIWASSNV